MPISTKPFELQAQRQRDARAALEAELQQAQAELQNWPALQDAVQNEVLPALDRWRQKLLPYTSTKHQQGYLRSIRQLKRSIRRLPWFVPEAVSLRSQILVLWIAWIWPVVVRVLWVVTVLTIVVATMVVVITYRAQIQDAIQGILEAFN
jgi:hypothetical protein